MTKILLAVVGVVAALGSAAEDLKAQITREKCPGMVLCVGSDWCVSGEKVRTTFDSAAFRTALGKRWLRGVRDHREAPGTEAINNENSRVKSLYTNTHRYPALFLFNEAGEPVGCFENIPQDITAAELAKEVAKREAGWKECEALIKKGQVGEGFDKLKDQMPGVFYHDRKQGWCSRTLPKEFAKLRASDPEDKEGWIWHFTMGNGMGHVYEANGLHEKLEEGRAYIAKLRARKATHLTVEQRQSIDMAEFALLRRDQSRKAETRALLRKVYEADPNSFWGWAAQGYLTGDRAEEYGDKAPPASTNLVANVKYGAGLVDLPMRGRPFVANQPRPDAAAKMYAAQRRKLEPAFGRRGLLTSELQGALVRTWAVHEAGTNTVQQLLRLEGGKAFLNAFLKDTEWVESFMASGPGNIRLTERKAFDFAAALTNLDALVWNDRQGRILKGGLPRTLATAIALQAGRRSIESVVRTWAGYMFLADAGRLHKAAYTQDVREWRFALSEVLGIADLLYLNDYVNYHNGNYGGACWFVPYRLHNCFGESIHCDRYYRPWRNAPWPGLSKSPTVGGVCGALSHFGAYAANAHGVLATTGGQPGHCAYNRRRPNGVWDIHNYVGRYTTAHHCFWGHAFTYLDVIERSYADRPAQLQADRLTWLARLAEDEKEPAAKVEAWYKLAVKANSKHYGAWRAYAEWLNRSQADLATTEAYLRALALALPEGRQPMWDLVNWQLDRIRKMPVAGATSVRKPTSKAVAGKASASVADPGADRVVAILEKLYPMLPQPTNTYTREEMEFSGVLNFHGRLVGEDVTRRSRLFKAALAAEVGRPLFAEVLGWGANWFLKDETRAKSFIHLVEEVSKKGAAKAGKGSKAAKFDCRGLMAAASRSGDIAVFRTVSDLFERLYPMDSKAPRYPETDFGGRLVSAKGMLMISSTCGHDKSELYGRTIDSTRQPNPNNPNDRGTFHTGKEKSPWAIVELPGDAQVTGIFLLSANNAERNVPFEVFVSTDKKEWQRVYQTDKAQGEYRISLDKPTRARYVKVARTPEAKEDFFHFGKILVYGKKLY